MSNDSARPHSSDTDWDASYRRGEWDFLGDVVETPRYATVAGYVHKLLLRGNVLDVGCGYGALVDYLDMSRFDYTGFDISDAAITRARDRYPNLKFFTCSVEDFTPPNNQRYAVIIFNEVLSQIPDFLSVLLRFYRFLDSGGYFVVSQYQNPNPDSKGEIWTRAFEVEIAMNRITLVAGAESCDRRTGRCWKCYCLSSLHQIAAISVDV